jgi:hypothetical protein
VTPVAEAAACTGRGDEHQFTFRTSLGRASEARVFDSSLSLGLAISPETIHSNDRRLPRCESGLRFLRGLGPGADAPNYSFVPKLGKGGQGCVGLCFSSFSNEGNRGGKHYVGPIRDRPFL